MNLKGFVALLVVIGVLWLAGVFGVLGWLYDESAKRELSDVSSEMILSAFTLMPC